MAGAKRNGPDADGVCRGTTCSVTLNADANVAVTFGPVSAKLTVVFGGDEASPVRRTGSTACEVLPLLGNSPF